MPIEAEAKSNCTGVFSSRRIQKRMREDIPFKVLAAGNEPGFRTISDFRKIHLASLKNMFEQVLAMALECGSIKLGKISLDGTKLKANASKHKAMSYGRMIEKQQQLKEEVKQLLEQAEAADEAEDREYGDQRGDELPEELRRRETRLAKIKAARKSWNNGRETKPSRKARAPRRPNGPSRQTRMNIASPIRSRVLCRARRGSCRVTTRKPPWSRLCY